MFNIIDKFFQFEIALFKVEAILAEIDVILCRLFDFATSDFLCFVVDELLTSPFHCNFLCCLMARQRTRDFK